MFAYVGGYTTPDRDGRGDGIHVYRIDAPGAAWVHQQHVGDLANPSLFTLRPDNRVLYSVHGGRDHITAFSIDPPTGQLRVLGRMPCQGRNPVDTALDTHARFLVVANYGSGSVAVMPLAPDGRLLPVHQVFELPGKPGPDPKEQAASHPHAVIFDPTGNYVIVPDKGFDCTFVFRFDATSGTLALTSQGPVPSRPGAAPRHCVFHPRLPVLYVNNELDSTVTVYGWDSADGALSEAQVIETVPAGWSGRNTTAEIAVTPDGRFLYVSNRGRDDIARFAIEQDGRLALRGHTPSGGRKPRFFTLDAGGAFLFAANQDSDDIVTFSVAKDTGALTPTGQRIGVGSPSAITLSMPSRGT
jgi:6-phosphogluconolactonase (cycloisomerase 2 family)